MRYTSKYFCLCLSCLLLLSVSACKYHSSSNSTPSTVSKTGSKSISAYKSATKAQSKRTYVNIESETLIRRWLDSAEVSIIIVDSLAPEWIPDELDRLQARKPFLKAQLASRLFFEDSPYVFIPELKASYIIIDFQYLIINPLYSSTDKGLTYVSDDAELVQEYLNFSQTLFAKAR